MSLTLQADKAEAEDAAAAEEKEAQDKKIEALAPADLNFLTEPETSRFLKEAPAR